MDNQVYTYALMKTFYDMGKDYIDCFLPFVIRVFSDGKEKELGNVQGIVKEETGLEIPQYTLKTILKRAGKRKYVNSLGHGKFNITAKGRNVINIVDSQEAVQRKIEELGADFSLFLTPRLNKMLDKSEALRILSDFIESNMFFVLRYVNPKLDLDYESTLEEDTALKRNIIEYIKQTKLNSPVHYKTLNEIILGSAMSLALFCPDISTIQEKFKGNVVFLDSNFVLSVLGLHHDEFAAPAQELFLMLKHYGFKIKIFDTTVTEICRVINSYAVFKNLYTKNVRVNSLYSKLCIKGWSKKQSRSFILSIEEDLSQIGIHIERLENVDLERYEPPKEDLIRLLSQYKPDQPRVSQNHDLIAIEEVRKRRRYLIRDLHRAKVLFLTSDLKLARFNFERYGHRNNSTISEVIPDFLIANLIWLQNPKYSSEIQLKFLIAAHSRNLFVQRKVWEHFINVLKQLKDDKCVSDDRIAALIYHGRIQELLTGIDESKSSKISPEFVMEEIEKAAADMDVKHAIKLKEKEKEIKDIFEEKMSKQEEEKNNEWLINISKIKDNIRKSVNRKASFWAFCISAISTIIILSIIGLLIYIGMKKCKTGQEVNHLTCILIGITVVIGSGGIVGVWRDVYKFSKSFLCKKFYIKKLTEAGLE